VNLSCIIVNYHNSHTLGDCLASIYQNPPASEFEVILINNSPNDTGWQPVVEQYPQAICIENKRNLGFASANNQGFSESRGQRTLFLNPDAILKPGAIEHMAEFLDAHPDVGIVGPRVLNSDGTIQMSCRRFPTLWTGLFNRYSLLSRWFPRNRFTRRYLMTDFDHDSTMEVDWVSGCCMMVPQNVFEEAGRFDENYFLFNEDVDLCRSVWQKGYRVMYEPAAEVVHQITTSHGKTDPRAIIKRHLGMSYYFKKHHRSNMLVQGMVDSVIALRCAAQLAFNLLRTP